MFKNYIPCSREDREQINRHSVSFGFNDERGREIGYTFAIDREFWVADEKSNSRWSPAYIGREIYRLQPHAMRDGVKYGAILNASIHFSLAEADAKAEDMIEAYRKKMAKKFA
jgi:hypothetical protein